ncbi:unnamed protein product [Calypogeia fissa]
MTVMKESSVQLLYLGHSPYCQTVAIALAAKGVPFTIIHEDMKKKSQLLLEANPVHKKVPVLIHNGKQVSESWVILQYIDEVWPTGYLGDGGDSLFPDTAYERAQARFWMDFIFQKVGTNLRHLVRGTDSEVDKKAFEENMGLLNSAIIQCSKGEKPFFFGKTIGAVDIVFAPFTAWFSSFEKFIDLKLPSSTEAPRLHEWITAITQHRIIKPVLTDPGRAEDKAKEYRANKHYFDNTVG